MPGSCAPQRRPQARGQPLGTAGIAPQTGRQAQDSHLEDAPQGVAGLPGPIDPLGEGPLEVRVQAGEGAGRAQLLAPRSGRLEGVLPDRQPPQLQHMGEELDACKGMTSSIGQTPEELKDSLIAMQNVVQAMYNEEEINRASLKDSIENVLVF